MEYGGFLTVHHNSLLNLSDLDYIFCTLVIVAAVVVVRGEPWKF